MRRLTKRVQELRDELLFEGWKEGMTVQDLAEMFDITIVYAWRIIKSKKEV